MFHQRCTARCNGSECREPSFAIFRVDELSFLRELPSRVVEKAAIKAVTPGLVDSWIVKIAKQSLKNSGHLWSPFRMDEENRDDYQTISWNRLSPVLHLSLLRLSQQRQSCDKLFRKRKRKKRQGPSWIDRASFDSFRFIPKFSQHRMDRKSI